MIAENAQRETKGNQHGARPRTSLAQQEVVVRNISYLTWSLPLETVPIDVDSPAC